MITIPHTLGQHFAYALGRLGMLEAELLVQGDIDRLLGAASGEEAVKMLRDIEFLPAAENAESFTETLNAGITLLKENVQKMAPEEKYFMFDILWLEGDRTLVSYAIKERHDFTSSLQIAPVPPVTSFTLDEWQQKFPDFHEKFSGPQDIDNAVALYINDFKKCLAKRSGSKMIQAYVERMIEIEEQRTKMRTEGGTMEAIVFEKEMVASLWDLLENMKLMTLGPEALFAYATRTLNHIALLKVLLTGKVNNLKIQEIKSILPPLL